MEAQSECARKGYQAIGGSDQYLAVVPDGLWPGESGLVALQVDAYWALNTIHSQQHCLERGVNMVLCTIPTGAATENGSKVFHHLGSDFNGYIGIESATDENTIDLRDDVKDLITTGCSYYDETMAIFTFAHGE